MHVHQIEFAHMPPQPASQWQGTFVQIGLFAEIVPSRAVAFLRLAEGNGQMRAWSVVIGGCDGHLDTVLGQRAFHQRQGEARSAL